MSKFKVGDKVRLIKGEGMYQEGVVDVVTRVEPFHNGRSLLWFEGELKKHIRIFDYRFELADEGPSSMAMTSFKVGDKVRRKVNDRSYSAWSHGDRVLTVSKIEKYRDQQVLMFKEVTDYSDGFRFEPVEEAKPAVEPQLPGVPEGFRAVRIGTPKKGEWYVGGDDEVQQGDGWQTAGGYVILEKIEQPAPPESLDDLVIQDRVPARAGIDFGWWVSPEEFDKFEPMIAHTWRVGIGYRDGLMHGYKHEACPDRLAVMCYRKDLPELPTVERVVLDEYLVWDTDGPKCLLWSTSNPTIETDSLGAWDHAYPTGNTREIEVPIVKP